MGFVNKHDLLNKGVFTDQVQFGIGEIAKMTGVSTRQLRYWESKGIIESIDRDGDEARVYNYKTYINVAAIKYFLDHDCTLKVAVDKTHELKDAYRTVHKLLFSTVKGVGELDGEEAIDLGYLNAQQKQRLYAKIDDNDQVEYTIKDVEN